MTSPKHGRLIEIFRAKPETIVEALRAWSDLELPSYSELEVTSGDLTLVNLKDLTADLVVLLRRGRPVLAIVLEVQLRRDPAKLRSWAAYVASLHSRHDCDVLLVVVTPSRSVARYASRPIRLGPGSVVTPLVLGPDTIPLLDGGAARAPTPELALLSSMSHPSDEAAALAALQAIEDLPAEQATLYFELILSSVSKPLRKHFEDLMASREFVFDNFYRRNYLAKGKAEGLAAGKAEGLAAAVLGVLDARGLRTTKAQRARALGCTDLATLERWLARAVTCSSASEVFTD